MIVNYPIQTKNEKADEGSQVHLRHWWLNANNKLFGINYTDVGVRDTGDEFRRCGSGIFIKILEKILEWFLRA